MSKHNTFETDILKLILTNVDSPNIGDAAGLQNSATEGSLYVSLHTSDPGETGDQTTNEISYTGYARVAVARNTGGWTVANGAAENAAAITFGACTAGSGTATHFRIGTASSGAGYVLYTGALGASLAISAGITPEFAAGALDLAED